MEHFSRGGSRGNLCGFRVESWKLLHVEQFPSPQQDPGSSRFRGLIGLKERNLEEGLRQEAKIAPRGAIFLADVLGATRPPKRAEAEPTGSALRGGEAFAGRGSCPRFQIDAPRAALSHLWTAVILIWAGSYLEVVLGEIALSRPVC